MSQSSQPNLSQRIAGFSYRVLRWSRDTLPPGVRSVLGLLFMVGGVLGFLPILGFWMLPLGAALIALDLPFTRKKIEVWMETLRERAG